MASPLLGRVLSERFRVMAFIGEGAMANVYRGLDLRVNGAPPRDVAIKIMHPQLMIDPTFLARFRREAKAAMRLKHPNTVQVIEYGVDKELVYIAMELLGGQDLFEALVVERRLSEARAAKVMIQICDALIAAHAEGIVHRDLKPENIMLLPDPTGGREPVVKVLDFGIAKILERDEQGPDSAPNSLATSALTTVGVVVGTPAYMSPEQCRGDVIDPRSDLYSCGVLLYQLVTGRVPFSGTTPIDIAMQQLRDPPPAPTELVPGLHPGLEATILTALAKWPAQRQENAADLKRELLQVLGELSDEVKPPSGAQIGGEPVSSREMRRLSSRAATAASPASGSLPSAVLSSEPATKLSEGVAEAQVRPTPDAALAPAVGPAVAQPNERPLQAPLVVAVVRGTTPAPTPPQALPPPSPAPSPAQPIAVALRPRSALETRPWLVVPIAVFLGVAMGTIAFLLMR